MIEFRNPHYIFPPGSETQILSHPKKANSSVELAIFQEHRYAFFYWSKWVRDGRKSDPPCLVSLDWHQDLCFPCEVEKEWLSKLNRSSDVDVALFAWSKMAGNNDGHILAAAFLNIIGNIYIHCRQGSFEDDWIDEKIEDLYGNMHLIKKFKSYQALESFLLSSEEEGVFFDIDLDFFTVKNPLNGVGEKFSYLPKKQAETMLSIERPLIEWVFERLEGFTIATEPEHCGGLLKSNRLLDFINRLYFYPDLFTMSCDWRHKI